VVEDVYINGLFSHTAEILNRIALAVEEGESDSVKILADFQTSEKSSGSHAVYEWGRDYHSEFLRDSRGRYDIGPEFFMPVLRDIPVFPEGEVEIGDTWNYPAEEVHDLRDSLGVPLPYNFPVDVKYTYLGQIEEQGVLLEVIEIKYVVFHKAPIPSQVTPLYPIRISGISKQVLHWNREAGRPEYSQEEFDYYFDLYSGDSIEYRGVAEGRVVEAVLMDREELADNLRKDLDERGLEETEVAVNDRGVTLTLRNIQFPADSSYLWDSEKVKLDEICQVLEGLEGHDIEIAGHTALAGTVQGRYNLSLERARAVGDYLLSQGCKNPDEVIIRGFGAEKPLADNETSQGQQLNRRVEITILEN